MDGDTYPVLMPLLLVLLLSMHLSTGTGEVVLPQPSPSSMNSAPPLAQRSFVIENDAFMRDGTPTAVLSGSMHYTRVHPKYWRDRLMRLRAMGLNTVCTYVPWMLHQRTAEEPPSFEGALDMPAFLREAQHQVRY